MRMTLIAAVALAPLAAYAGELPQDCYNEGEPIFMSSADGQPDSLRVTDEDVADMLARIAAGEARTVALATSAAAPETLAPTTAR